MSLWGESLACHCGDGWRLLKEGVVFQGTGRSRSIKPCMLLITAVKSELLSAQPLTALYRLVFPTEMALRLCFWRLVFAAPKFSVLGLVTSKPPCSGDSLQLGGAGLLITSLT